MRTRFLLATMLLALLVATGAVLAQDEVTLRYYTWEDSEQEMVDICAAELGYNIEYMPVTGTGVGELMAELRALNTAGELPDVFWMSSGFVDEFAFDGLLYNIQEYVDRDIMPQAEDYFVGSFDAGRFPTKTDSSDMYAFPWRFVETILYYNMDAFDAAGVDYPAEGWTWDDFLAAAEALTIDNNDDGLIDQYGYYFFGRYAHIESWVYQNGGAWLSEDRQSFEASPEAVETIEFLNSLINEHGVAPQPAELEGVPDIFASGLAAMWVDGIWNVTGLRDTATFNWAVGPVPRGPNWAEETAYGWSDMISIGATTEYPEESWDLIQCLTGPNRTVDLGIGGTVPVYRPTALGDDWIEPDMMPANKSFILDWAQYIGPTSFTPGWGEWRGYVDGAGLQGQLDEAFNGNLTVDEAITNATDFANSVLDRFYGEE